MNYFLFKLQFETAVHFGSSDAALSLATSEEHIRADTLFSALCQTALCLYGRAGAGREAAPQRHHALAGGYPVPSKASDTCRDGAGPAV